MSFCFLLPFRKLPYQTNVLYDYKEIYTFWNFTKFETFHINSDLILHVIKIKFPRLN